MFDFSYLLPEHLFKCVYGHDRQGFEITDAHIHLGAAWDLDEAGIRELTLNGCYLVPAERAGAFYVYPCPPEDIPEGAFD